MSFLHSKNYLNLHKTVSVALCETVPMLLVAVQVYRPPLEAVTVEMV